MTNALQLLSPEIQLLLLGVAPPVAVATPLLLFAWRPWRRDPAVVDGPAWCAPFALVLGFTAAFAALLGWGFLTPARNMEWLPYAGLAAATVGLVARPARPAPVVALVLAAAWSVIAILWRNRWDGGVEGLRHLGIAALALLVLTAGFFPLASRSRGPILPLALTLVFATAGYVLFGAAHSSSLGQLSGAMVAGLGVCTGLAIWNRNFTLGPSGSLVAATLLGTLLLNGIYANYGYDMPVVPCALVALGAVLSGVEHIPALHERSLPVRGTATLAAVAIPLAIAAWMSFQIASEYSDY